LLYFVKVGVFCAFFIAPLPPSTKTADAEQSCQFVLDINGLLYADDSQIVALQSLKAHDNISSCNGRVEVQVWRVQPGQMHPHLSSPYHFIC
jgi:hypothetical protein